MVIHKRNIWGIQERLCDRGEMLDEREKDIEKTDKDDGIRIVHS